MQIVSFNVAGLRAIIKKNDFTEFINKCIENVDIICLQETECTETEGEKVLTDNIKKTYPFRYWNSTKGTTQRKGLSGVSVWCTSQPISVIDNPDFDEEGRILALEFENSILINVYVPNSQKFENDRYYFRENWNVKFQDYINKLKTLYKKEIIICGDLNVAHLDIDINNPKAKKNKIPGFFDNERHAFGELLSKCGLVDVFRNKNSDITKSTYWSNFLKAERTQKNGWGIDYFLMTNDLYNKGIVENIEIMMNVLGSDHCPLKLLLSNKI